MRFLHLLALVLSVTFTAVAQEPQWIWLTEQSADEEVRYFRKTFTLAAMPTEATLAVSCDNRAKVFVNGVEIGKTDAWQQPLKVRIEKQLKAGENVLAIRGKNDDGTAALVARLEIKSGGTTTVIVSDATWLSFDKEVPGWEKPGFAAAGWTRPIARAKLGSAPWGDVFAGAGKTVRAGSAGVATDATAIQVPPGFKIELLYTVPKAEQGSWVTMTEDPKGRLIVGDQYGRLYRVAVPPIGTTTGSKVEPIAAEITGAHGLLFAFDSLYVMVNETSKEVDGQKSATGRPAGLYRLKYRAADDSFGAPELLRKFDGSGEHGTHGLVLGPDGKSIYFANGNHTKPPDAIDFARPVAIGEDHLITRLWDANGHAKGILAPGGYVGKIDPDGKRVELFAGGFRNQYDIAFDANGELFTFDSDMEWDLGSPWYMPTRINHIVAGGDYGWRSGAGRWPDYYADSLPTTVDIGPGSPTGTVFGTGAKFPAKYQRALFALDWTYATIWAIHFTPDGASFKAEKEDFLSGRGFSVTDAIVRKADGALYIAIGGRRNQSALYRLTYTGTESTAPVAPLAPTAEAKLRHSLEALQENTSPEAIDKAWPHLASKDRFIRFAARIVLEHQPAGRWAERALAEKNPQATLEALIALARVGDKALQPKLLAALGQLDFAKLSGEQRLALLRAWQLAFTRMGKPAPEVCAQIVAKLGPLFPNADPLANRELVSLLVFLDSPAIVARAVPLLGTAKDADITVASDAVLARNDGYAKAVEGMHDSRPNRQAIAYAYALREAKAGWTPELRKAFFGWFPRTQKWKGGNSFTKFLDNIRKDALTNGVPDETERGILDALSKQAPPAVPANLVLPKGPGKNYSVDDVVALAQGLKGRNFEQGKAMYASTLCVNCHKIAGDGGNIGPDLTGSGQRYTLRDLMENIVEPSKVISDQYGTEQIELKDGNLVVGRVIVEENDKLFVMTSALAPDAQTTVDAAQVKSRQPFNVSMMPPGLINSLNKDELLDLVAYLQSGGNPNDKVFSKK